MDMLGNNGTVRREIVLDVETTGLEYDGVNPGRIIEIGAVELVNWQHSGNENEFCKLVSYGGVVVPDEITKITGLTKEDLSDAPCFEDTSVVDALLDYIGDSDIVAHNASFDRGFLNEELKRCKREIIPENRWIDTMELARKKFPGERNSLDHLCERFKIFRPKKKITKHRALEDARRLAKVYQALNNRLTEELGLETAQEETVILSSEQTDSRNQPVESLRNEQERIAHHDFLQETFKGKSIWSSYREE